MSVLEEIVQIVPSLGPAEQRQVLDVVIRLRDARKLPDITLPAADTGDAAWDEWGERVRARSIVVMAEEKQRLQTLGILDEHGNVLTDALPADMRIRGLGGGHAAPEAEIRDIHSRSLSNLVVATDVFERIELYDNSAWMAPPRRVGRVVGRRLVAAIDPVPNWVPEPLR